MMGREEGKTVWGRGMNERSERREEKRNKKIK
jgi:hypothetical protein